MILPGAAAAQAPGNSPQAAVRAPEPKPAAAVYVAGGIPDHQKAFLGAYLLNAIINSGADVSDDNADAFAAAVDEEHAKRRTTSLDDSLLCEIGRKTGVRYICAVSATPAQNGVFTLSGRIISVKTGQSRFNGEAAGALNTMGDLAHTADMVLAKMFGGGAFGGQPAPKAAPSASVSTPPVSTPPVPMPSVQTPPDSTPSVSTPSAVSTPSVLTPFVSTPPVSTSLNEFLPTAADAAPVDTAETVTVNTPIPTAAVAQATLYSATAAAATQEEPETRPNIAVYVTGNVPDNEKKALGTHILAALVNSGRYNGIERTDTFLAEIDKEQATQRSGAVDDSQISQVGRQFGVKYVCIADITPALGAFQISARVVNVETAEVAFIGQAASPLATMDDLTNVSDKVVRRMFNLPEPPPEKDTIFRKPVIEISVGAGGLIAGGYGGGMTWPDGKRVKMPYSAVGIYLFFDAVYAELFFGYANGNGKWESPNAADPQNLPYMPRTYINGGLSAKYPFTCYDRIRLFPLLGLDYEMSISGRVKNPNGNDYVFDGTNNRPDANALSSLWFQFGGGIDFDMGKTVYLRSELIYGLRAANEFEWHCADKAQSGAWAEFGQGLGVKIGVGAKF